MKITRILAAIISIPMWVPFIIIIFPLIFMAKCCEYFIEGEWHW
jgi:hypothetical protein